MTYVCITGNEQNPSSLEQRLERALKAHPRVLCELRLDYLDMSPAAAFAFLAKLPPDMAPRLILTQRLKASGPTANGHCPWDVHTWQSWWKDVMALRPWFAVDLDWLVLDRLAGESLVWGGKFRSRHAFFSLHANLPEIESSITELIASAKEHNAGVKIATPVQNAQELLTLAKLSKKLEGLPLQISVPMGQAGRAWRWSKLAGDISYFAADSARATAPGQDSFADVLPYLSTKHRPEIYALLSDNPENRYGEKRWNRAFIRRGAKARYLNVPLKDQASELWGNTICDWMDEAHVSGASVTKPFKLSFSEPTNTLKKNGQSWERANTDGDAVREILNRYGISTEQEIVIAGGGGAARAVQDGLQKFGYKAHLWTRENGRLGECPAGSIFISTWPGEFQEALVEAIPTDRKFNLVIDAQFSREPDSAPLALWSKERSATYLYGDNWWKIQARLQDIFWFGSDRLGIAKKQILDLVPSSKSETIRALAIAGSFGVPSHIHNPSICDDTEIFLAALEELGVSVDKNGDSWNLFPNEQLLAPNKVISMGEGATGLRILGALSTVMQGDSLKLDAEPTLKARTLDDLFSGLEMPAPSEWPISLPVGRKIPTNVSLERSSQFASGFFLAAASQVFKNEIPSFTMELSGDQRSRSYLALTANFLRDAGIKILDSEQEIKILPGEKKLHKLSFQIEKDASSLAYFEVLASRWKLDSFYSDSMNRQGDAIFPKLLGDLIAGKNQISLKHYPDLAPPLWAAAALLRRKIEITECPQLRLKESDRALLLVDATKKIGAKATLTPGGFVADFSFWVPVKEEIFLTTDGDHRLAMAFGLIQLDFPNIQPDRKDCVRKSFPGFWQALQIFDEALPG